MRLIDRRAHRHWVKERTRAQTAPKVEVVMSRISKTISAALLMLALLGGAYVLQNQPAATNSVVAASLFSPGDLLGSTKDLPPETAWDAN
jgi:hypothetical protein